MTPTPTTPTAVGQAQPDPLGPVMPWPPHGVGDFADLAWVLAEVLGNGPGICGLDLHRATGGQLFCYIRCDEVGYVYDVAGRLGWSLSSANSPRYACVWGRVGDMLVDLTWQATTPDTPDTSDTATAPTPAAAEGSDDGPDPRA